MTTPAFPTPHSPAAAVGGPNAARAVAGFLWLVAAGLAVGASFVPFYRFTQTLANDEKFEYAVSGWSWNLRVTGDIQVTLGPPSLYGIPLVLAGVVLLLATVVAFTRWSPRAIGMLGTGLVIGAVSMEFVDAVANNGRARENLVTKFELGTWLLLGSVALALIGTVLAFVRTTPKPQYQQMWPPRVEPDTPRFGFPAPTPPPSAPTAPPSNE
jgi:F0F1-type ATP synthase membrane subunit c/vacuolar-type H+-ATPase subunit K